MGHVWILLVCVLSCFFGLSLPIDGSYLISNILLRRHNGFSLNEIYSENLGGIQSVDSMFKHRVKLEANKVKCASAVPTAGASAVPTAGASAVPTAGASAVPTAGASAVPTAGASAVPTAGASAVPTAGASAVPTAGASAVPTAGASSILITSIS